MSLSLNACAQKTSTPQVSAASPDESYDASETMLENHTSYLSMPFEISIKELEKELNNQFKGLVYEDNSFDRDDMKVKIWKQKDMTFKAKEKGYYAYEVPLKVWVEKRTTVFGLSNSASTQFEILTKFSSKPEITKDWKLKTHTVADGFEWISEPKLSMGGMNIPITTILSAYIKTNQNGIAQMIDKTVYEDAGVTDNMLKFWNSIKTPTLVSEENDIWLQVIPEEAFMTPLVTDNKHIRASVALKGIIKSSYGKSNIQAYTFSKVLPPLQIISKLPDEYNINLYTLVTYEAAEKLAKSMFVGQKYELTKKKEIKVENLHFFGTDKNQLVMEIQTSGSLNGTIYLTGDPVYDSTRREIILSNTEFDLKSRSVLKKAAAWVLEGHLEHMIEKDFGIPVDPILEMARTSASEFYNSDFGNGIKLNGGISDLQPQRVFLKKEGLMTEVGVKGKIAVKL